MIATINWDVVWEGLIVAIATSGVTGIFSYIKWIAPRRKEKEQKERDDQIAWDGAAEIPGVRDAVLAMPVRVQALETGFKNVVIGQGKLEQRMDEANGTSRRIEGILNRLVPVLPTKDDLAKTAVEVATVAQAHQDQVVATVKTEVASNKDEIVAAIHQNVT